jgi:hypothetical protein
MIGMTYDGVLGTAGEQSEYRLCIARSESYIGR